VFQRNVSDLLQDYTATQPRVPKSLTDSVIVSSVTDVICMVELELQAVNFNLFLNKKKA
jgi:hypothetical protein